MFIAHYKSVNSPEEFFSSKRDSLDFPTQVEYKGKRYLLNTTHIASSISQEKKIISYAQDNRIDFNVEV
jgi:hypothetical protein